MMLMLLLLLVLLLVLSIKSWCLRFSACFFTTDIFNIQMPPILFFITRIITTLI